MSIYEVIAFISILFALPKDRFRNSKALAIIMIGVLVVVAAIRDLSVGTDTYGYYDAFIYMRSIEDLRTSIDEPVFAMYTYLCRRFLNYDWYMLITYGIMICSFLCVSYKKTTNFALSVYLFMACGFYLFSFNAMRQYLAASITFWALYVLEIDCKKEKEKNVLFFVITLIATLIHNTAIIVVLVFLVRKMNISNRGQLIFVIGSFVLGFFLSAFFWRFFQSSIPDIGRYGTYLEFEGGSGGRNIISNLGMNVLFITVMYLSEKSIQRNAFYIAFFISIIIFNLVGGMQLLTRLTDNLAIAQIITIPVVIRYTKNNFHRYGLIVLVFIYSLLRFSLYLKNPDILPYIVRPDMSFF